MTGIRLPEDYIRRMRVQLGDSFADYMAAMECPPSRGLRVNTLKISVGDFLNAFPYKTKPSGIIDEGFSLDEGVASIGSHVLHRAGLFYMQEPSAMLPASLLAVKPQMRVLDICAAPGGKSGQIAAYLNAKGLLVANEIVPDRARVLAHTLERLGVRNSIVTCMKPDALCSMLKGCFDAVIVDAPCSGEGMFRKEPLAIRDWSLKHVRSCAKRQAAILDSAATALKPGGILVYSTCTFAAKENEENVNAFLERTPGFSLAREERLYPHNSNGEGQYVAQLHRTQGVGVTYRAAKLSGISPDARRAYAAFIEENLEEWPEGEPYLLPSGRIALLPSLMPENFRKLRIICAGVQAGVITNNRFVPAHALAMAYERKAFKNTCELNAEQARAYFNGEEFSHSGEGYHAICAKGYTLGFGKASNGVMKSLLKKGLRGEVIM